MLYFGSGEHELLKVFEQLITTKRMAMAHGSGTLFFCCFLPLQNSTLHVHVLYNTKKCCQSVALSPGSPCQCMCTYYDLCTCIKVKMLALPLLIFLRCKGQCVMYTCEGESLGTRLAKVLQQCYLSLHSRYTA